MNLFFVFRFTWPSLHSSRDLHVYGETATVFLTWCDAGKVTLCHTLSWGPSEWLKCLRTQTHPQKYHTFMLTRTYCLWKFGLRVLPFIQVWLPSKRQEFCFLDHIFGRNLHLLSNSSPALLDNMEINVELHFYFLFSPWFPVVRLPALYCCHWFKMFFLYNL